jgi:lipopolysaccharide/colanic/teichoic acid biosynthesis glycosyltransferase
MAVSLAALVLLSPLLVAIAIAVRLTSSGPVLFVQRRMGRAGVPFWIMKFRTMRDGVAETKAEDGSNLVVEGDSRITPLGRVLRSWSLDELPQLWNVWSGEMSIVGPRPDQVEHSELYGADEARKLEMKPGITGLAMIRGRNALLWKERARLDVWYVEHYSLLMDVQIVLRTIPAVLLRRGVYGKGETDGRGVDDHA